MQLSQYLWSKQPHCFALQLRMSNVLCFAEGKTDQTVQLTLSTEVLSPRERLFGFRSTEPSSVG